MSAQDKFQLYIYDGDYGLPSLNVECIQSVLYCAIANIPVELRLQNTIKNCVFYNAPCFVHKNLTFNSFKDIVLYLRTLKYNLDSSLSSKQCSEALAMTHLVQSKMQPVLEYLFWMEKRNHEELINIWFMRALPMPFNYIHTKRFKENAHTLLETMYPQEFNLENMENVKDLLSAVATECLSSLSSKLGTNDYFFGPSPTSLDVVVYSYLAPLSKIPFPSNDISSLVALWPNLVSFIQRIDTKYLPEVPKETKYIKSDSDSQKSEDEVSYVAVSILTVSAVSLVLGFAINRGLISSHLFS